MPAASYARKSFLALLGSAVALTGLQVLSVPSASAEVTSKISSFPYVQDWSDAALLTTAGDWSAVPGVQGYSGGSTSFGFDPQVVLGDSSATTTTTAVNQTNPNTLTSGGLAEFAIADPVVAMQGSGSARAPQLVFHLDLTGKAGATFAFDARDIDGSADNSVQPIAVQYRVGSTGDYTNLPGGSITDASEGPSLATLVTHRSVALPASTDGQNDVYVRVLTIDASGSDEWIGIDNINITAGDGGTSTPLAASDVTKTAQVGTAIAPFKLTATGGTAPYTWSLTSGSLPGGVDLAADGTLSGTPTASGDFSATVTVTDSADPAATDTAAVAFTVADAPPSRTIAEIQGTGAESPLKGQTVTTQGVVTAVYDKGFATTTGAATCGFCGFYLQTGGSGGAVDSTPGASDGLFVFGGSGVTPGSGTFGGTTVAVGDSVQVTGAISEFNGTTELTASAAGSVTAIAALPPVTLQTAIPAYADREAHEGEKFAPTDVVVTDTYNFETFGEFGLATGDRPLVQPGEICADDDTTCVRAARQDSLDRGIFLEDGSNTSYLTSSTFYHPKDSKNSDIPLPFVDKTHTVRVGAKVTFPAGTGGVLEFRNNKWYLQPQRSVMSTHDGAPDLGQDVVTFENTRQDNLAPADVGGDLKIATYNVENYFNIAMTDFAAANPFYSCEYDDDRAGNHVLAFQCTSPQAIPDQWDAAGNPTHYAPGPVSAPRGAARQEDFARQTAKIVTAINGLGADIVSLEELENPNKLRLGVTNPPTASSGTGTPIAWRDETISYLVSKLNDAAGAGTWGFVASPSESTNGTSVPGMCSTKQADGTPVPGPASTAGTCSWASGQDVIRSGFIYRKASVVPVGESDLDLPGSSAPYTAGQTASPFDNAREPLGQFFKPVGHPNSDGFAVIVNHFKSKGDSDPKATGDNANSPLYGAFNGDRTRQANELVRFANEFADKWHTDKVFLVGDFNAYTMEDPIQAILNSPDDELDFGLVNSTDTSDLTYVFSNNVNPDTSVDCTGSGGTTGCTSYGAIGSLDHVFGSAAARAMITGVDVWEINANEPGVYNYGRYNTNKTDFWDGTLPFGGSDHNPEIIGIDLPDNTTPVTDVQLLATNDFHGRLQNNTGNTEAGAAVLAGAVKQLRGQRPNTIFAAAGDLIGASTFESFIAHDKPTLEALSAAGLDVSAVGNHEFDQGYEDLINRVMKPYDASTNPYGAEGGLSWQYIGANVVYHADPDGDGPIEAGDPVVLPTWTKTVDGVKIGFVGAVTEDLLSLVSPGGMQNIDVTSITQAVNTYADQLKADGANLVVLLVHEGSPTTNCSTMKSDGSNFASVLNGLDANVDTVVSGHTHLEYDCSFTVPEWVSGDKPITQRPVVSAGQYGMALDQLVYSFDDATKEPVAVVHNNLDLKGSSTNFTYPSDASVQAIVNKAVADAEGPGAQVLGKIGGAFNRARLSNGTTENRGGESTLGNLVAEIQRWATPTTTGIEPAQIAFMNPGGLRADLLGTGASYPKDVTYKQAAAVQPFANTLVNMDMTAAQIKTVLEQQWQRDGAGNVPSRPFLRLGTSKGFTYTYYETDDPAHAGAKLGHVTGMWLNGTPLSDTGTYSVTMNSFLATGGDNFRAFAQGADKRDTGKTDLQAQVDYMAANAQSAALTVDYGQHAVSVTFPGGAPASYRPGDHVTFTLGSLDMTAPGDVKDDTLQVKLGAATLGDPVTVTHSTGTNPADEYGTATVDVVVPAGTAGGTALLHVIGATGTDVIVPVTIEEEPTLTAGTPTIDDTTPVAGQTLTASPGTWGPEPVDLTYQWLADGDEIDGADQATFTVTAAQVGQHLSVRVTGTKAGYQSASATSAATAAVVLPTLAAGTPTIDDTTPVAGQTLTASPGTWGPEPVDLTYQWLADGDEIDGADEATFTVTAAQVGQHLSVRVTGTKAGYQSASATSAATGAVLKVTPTLTVTAASVSYGRSAVVTVKVTAQGMTPTGTVSIKRGSTVLGTATVVGGVATVTLPKKSLQPGNHTLTASYSGDASIAAGSTTFTFKVVKASVRVAASSALGKVKVNKGRAAITVTVTGADGVVANGVATVSAKGLRTVQVSVRDGRATVRLAKFRTKGTKTVRISYLGSSTTNAGSATVTVRVVK